MKKFFKGSYFAIIMAFIYIPIIIMIIFSFNSGGTTFSFLGWDTKWYGEFINNSPFVKSIITSLFVAVISTAVSLVIGTMAAIGLSRTKSVTQKSWFNVANIPLINADVVTAVSLMIIFIVSGMSFGIGTLIMAHISFNVPYVLITVMPRLRKIDKSLLESAQDLGAKPYQVLFKVILPILKPAIITAAAIAFAMSFDDFIISYFTGGSQTNVSTFIYTAKKIKPFIFAFGTILVGAIVLVIIGWNAFAIFKQHKEQNKEAIKSGLYKQKQIHKLNLAIDELVAIIESGQIIRPTKKINLWVKYWFVNLKLKWIASRNFDKKIAKLEWKQSRIKSQINKEKRYYSRRDNTKKQLKKLNAQLARTKTDVKKAAKLTLQIEKLEDKLIFLNEEIEYIENRDELSKQKAKEIQNDIKKLKYNFKKEIKPSKKTISWYNKKIKELEQWKIEVEEGKNHYKLRLVVERLKNVKELNYNQIILLNEKSLHLYNLTHPKKSLTSKLDYQILKTKNENEKQNLIIEKQAQLLKFNNKYFFTIDKKLQDLNFFYRKVEKLKNKLNPPDDREIIHTKGFIVRSWKIIAVSLIGLSAFAGLTVAYIKNNIYDLVIGNWGEYIDPDIITDFEKKYGVKVNYQEYDSNETLYNKLYTFNYDVMVPSDYMVQKLAQENALLKLDYSKLNVKGTIDGKDLNPNKPQEGQEQVELVSGLLETMHSSKAKESEEDSKLYPEQTQSTGTILSYAIPYFWGDLVMVVNPTEANKEFLTSNGVNIDPNTNEIISTTLSWDLLWKAKDANKRLALNSDPKNIFMLAAEKNYQKVNLNKITEVDVAAKDVKNLILANNVSLNGDDLITKVSLGQFDFALMYNGDALYANQVYNHEDDEDDSNDGETKFIYGRPNKKNVTTGYNEGTNIFSDNMVISKKSNHQDLAYLWVNFILENMNLITSYVGIPSPSQSAMDEMLAEDGDFADYPDLYKPKDVYEGLSEEGKQLSFQYQEGIDDYLVDQYNNIVSGKIG
ncbi:spermidine/putrescine ABC transporter permease [Williamsoniiplasma somnilux]|uniref:Spermidine/putrescine ABC transporter permease n=1 Tax=Williamsoniiplasma somnilux TaxID=215578 RepID=A0A2K8NYZ9_9MOLU|nr:spermidine/putrescine ABC transporter permease/substrate-binding protein [Williamsoniiplasma somnilux]ATZ18964.1 spermidine/putrescine ABC transporter permease [Williamsoniiplasma somnilux]